MKRLSAKKTLKDDLEQPLMSFEEIGNILGISRQRVEQIEKKAVQKLAKLDAWEDIKDTIDMLNAPKLHQNNSTRRSKARAYSHVGFEPTEWAHIEV
jgi:transcriptional regulator with XRE-family HTH domain